MIGMNAQTRAHHDSVGAPTAFSESSPLTCRPHGSDWGQSLTTGSECLTASALTSTATPFARAPTRAAQPNSACGGRQGDLCPVERDGAEHRVDSRTNIVPVE